MAVTEGFVQGPPDSTGKKVDTSTVIQTDGGTAHREGSVIADPENLAARASVQGQEPGPLDYGAVVRIAPDKFARRAAELVTVADYDQNNYPLARRAGEKVTLLDRRGSVGRGSTR